MNTDFEFLEPGRLIDDDLELVLVVKYPGNAEKNLVPAYRFEMRHVPSGKRMGGIDLRVGDTYDLVHYGGHLGYGVDAEFRGRHYAARSCRLLLPLAKQHGINPVWITCNPDNRASRRTCELAGARYAEIVDLPEHIDMYKRGERQKCRYRIDL
jgi:tagatose 1,6-diphosphate aldolase